MFKYNKISSHLSIFAFNHYWLNQYENLKMTLITKIAIEP